MANQKIKVFITNYPGLDSHRAAQATAFNYGIQITRKWDGERQGFVLSDYKKELAIFKKA